MQLDRMREIDERIGNDDFWDIARCRARFRFSPFAVNRKSPLNDNRDRKKKRFAIVGFSIIFRYEQLAKREIGAQFFFLEILFSADLSLSLARVCSFLLIRFSSNERRTNT